MAGNTLRHEPIVRAILPLTFAFGAAGGRLRMTGPDLPTGH